MRRPVPTLALALALALLAGAVVPAGAGAAVPLARRDPGVGGFLSPNVTYVGTIPVDSPGVGGKVVSVGDQTRFYVTGLKGLTIYDVTNPALPTMIGALPFPHAQNEDVDVSDDGSRVVISADGSLLLPIMRPTRGVHVIDTSDPTLPMLAGSHATGSHTTTCADAACDWLYTSNGTILDARDPANIVQLPNRWKPTNGSAHALNRDAAGLLVSDSNPRFVLDPRADPAAPVVLAAGSRNAAVDNSLQHNNVRPRADEWVPRAEGDDDAALRPGELLIANSESNLNADCGDLPGGLSTWSMVDFDKGASLVQLDAFLPFNGTWADGNPAVNGLGCSGHWFTERDGIVTAAWYEHGIRFLSVDETTGEIEEVGYFQPVATEAGAAHWVPGPDGAEYVYSVDYARGIDILRFDRSAPRPTPAQIEASWLANLGTVGALAARERAICRLSQR